MLEAKHDNSKATFALSSIKLSKVAEIISILNFRLMDMAKFNAPLLIPNDLYIGLEYEKIQ
jgi:hypothetical protein